MPVNNVGWKIARVLMGAAMALSQNDWTKQTWNTTNVAPAPNKLAKPSTAKKIDLFPFTDSTVPR